VRKFPSCNYGPWILRHTLRTLFERGERLIGWSPITRDLDQTNQFFLISMSFIPLFGPAFQAMAIGQTQRLAVLSDRRLLILPITKKDLRPERSGKRIEIPLSTLDIQAVPYTVIGRAMSLPPRFALDGPGLERPVTITIKPLKKPRSNKRLIQALTLMAADIDAET